MKWIRSVAGAALYFLSAVALLAAPAATVMQNGLAVSNGVVIKSGALYGNASGATNLNGTTAFGSGTIPTARLPGYLPSWAAYDPLTLSTNGVPSWVLTNRQSLAQLGSLLITNPVYPGGRPLDLRFGTDGLAFSLPYMGAGMDSAGSFFGGFSGDGGSLTSLNATALSSGVVPIGRLPAVVVTNGASTVSFGSVNVTGAGAFASAGAVSGNEGDFNYGFVAGTWQAGMFNGNGQMLYNLDGTKILPLSINQASFDAATTAWIQSLAGTNSGGVLNTNGLVPNFAGSATNLALYNGNVSSDAPGNIATTNNLSAATNTISSALVTRIASATNDLNTTLVSRVTSATNDLNTTLTNKLNGATNVVWTYFATNKQAAAANLTTWAGITPSSKLNTVDSGSGLSNLNASALSSGTVPLARLHSSVVTNAGSATLSNLTTTGTATLPSIVYGAATNNGWASFVDGSSNRWTVYVPSWKGFYSDTNGNVFDQDGNVLSGALGGLTNGASATFENLTVTGTLTGAPVYPTVVHLVHNGEWTHFTDTNNAIGAAVSNSVSGDTIYVRSADYYPTNPINMKAFTRIVGIGPTKPRIVSQVPTSKGVCFGGASYALLANLEITNSLWPTTYQSVIGANGLGSYQAQGGFTNFVTSGLVWYADQDGFYTSIQGAENFEWIDWGSQMFCKADGGNVNSQGGNARVELHGSRISAIGPITGTPQCTSCFKTYATVNAFQLVAYNSVFEAANGSDDNGAGGGSTNYVLEAFGTAVCYFEKCQFNGGVISYDAGAYGGTTFTCAFAGPTSPPICVDNANDGSCTFYTNAVVTLTLQSAGGLSWKGALPNGDSFTNAVYSAMPAP